MKQTSSGNDFAYINKGADHSSDSEEDIHDIDGDTSEVKVDPDEDSSSISTFDLNLTPSSDFHQNGDGFLEHLETPTEHRTFDYLIDDSSIMHNDKEECQTKL